MVLCQLQVGHTLRVNAAAGHLLANLVEYAETYRRTSRPLAFVGGADTPLAQALKEAGAQYSSAPDTGVALGRSGSIVLVEATPAHLHALASNLPAVKSFTAAGGWLVLAGVTPEGLNDYNKIVGFDHMIRPFGREKVTFPAVRSPLLAGLAASNIAMSSGKRIFDWQAGDYPDTNAFSYVGTPDWQSTPE